VTALDPTVAAVDLVRAQVLFGAGQQRAAVEAASHFLTKQPRHADALIVRGRARVAIGHTRDAVGDFTKALDLRPAPDLYVERARVMPKSRAAEIEAVLRGLDAGIEQFGSLVTLELEAIHLERRLKRYDAALRRLDRASALAARKDPWLARRGEILEQAGRIDEARTAYNAALAAMASVPAARQTRASSVLIARLRASLERLGPHAGSH
jgi:tetratricopeptide (TPR) repeat protein